MKKLHLEDLINGNIKGLSKNVSAFLFEAAVVTLFLNDHQPGVTLQIEGDHQESFQLFWEIIPPCLSIPKAKIEKNE